MFCPKHVAVGVDNVFMYVKLLVIEETIKRMLQTSVTAMPRLNQIS